MKYRAFLAATAILSMNVTSPAFAAVTLIDPTPAANPGQEIIDGMQTQCDALAAAHDTGNGDIWTGQIVLGAVTYVSGPTEVGTHGIGDAIPGTLVGAGTFTPGSVSILGDPYRIGGSVNMFGVQQSTGGHYSASTYDFMADFTTTYAHAFSCDISQAVFHAGDPSAGSYVIAGEFGDSNDAIRGNCAAFTALGDNNPRPPWWGDPFHGGTEDAPHCMFVGAPTEDSWDPPVFVVNEVGESINVEQTDNLRAHEDAGEGYDIGDTVLIGQTVICISPTTSTQTKKGVPGTWVKKNGYTGDKCTTAWFNVAPWGAGSQDSNGTYISVPLS